MFLKFTSTTGRKFSLHVRQIGAYASEGKGTRIWASIAGMPVCFVVDLSYTEVETMIEKQNMAESEQSA